MARIRGGKKGPDAKYPVESLPSPVEFYWGPIIDRHTARAMGRKRFFTGEPCIHNHVAERWVSSATCIECTKERHRSREYREQYAKPYLREYAAENPDKVEEYNAQRRAVKAARPVKSEARREGNRRAWARRKAENA